jgi:hypothetical protein
MKKIFVRIVVGILLVFGLNTLTLKPSSLFKFPVPITAKIGKKYDDTHFTYEWNGINRFYYLQVQLAGWRKVDQFGSLVIYSRGENKVGLATKRGSFTIYKEE